MKFSIILIARNEEKTLPRLVESLFDFREKGGKIVLIDTGSTDKTAQVARDLGCIVEEVGDRFKIIIDTHLAKQINKRFVVKGEGNIVKAGESLFDFASARNYAASLSPTDVIAMPDCDEIRTALDVDKINELIHQGYEHFEYNFVFSHDDQGKPLVQFMHSKFYDRRKMHWVGIIHEVLQGSANKIFLDENIAKLEHYQNVETNRSGYLKGLAVDCFHNPNNDRNSHYLAREMLYFGRPKSAIKEFQRHIDMNKWHIERSQSYVHMGEAYMMIGDTDNGIRCFNKAFDLEPYRREPLLKLAEYYWQINSPMHVIAYCEAALKLPGTSFYANYEPYYSYFPHELLYWAYWHVGNIEKSKEHYDKAYAYNSKNPKYIRERLFYYPESFPLISFLLPTRGERPEGMLKVSYSIDNLNYPNKETIIIDNKTQTCPEKVREGVRQSEGEWLVFASDDMEFDKESVMNAYVYCLVNDTKFVAFNSGEVSQDEGNICEHFMIHKSIIPKGDEIFDCEFNHVGVDNLLWEQMKRLGYAYRCQNAVVHHYHWSKGNEMDETYRVSWNEENVKKDRELLAKKLNELK